MTNHPTSAAAAPLYGIRYTPTHADLFATREDRDYNLDICRRQGIKAKPFGPSHDPLEAPVVAQDERNPDTHTITLSLDLNTPQGITTLRAALGMTREQFAAALSCSPETLRKWEAGRTNPLRVYLDRMQELARELAQP